MRHATALFAVLAISGLASATPEKQPTPQAKAPPQAKKAPPPATPTTPATPAALSESSKMLAPIQVESLTLTPIVSTKQKIEDEKLIVLDEAMTKKLVRIHEVDDEDVNNLKLTNKSDQALFLLAGEVIIGGKQDRIIGRNTIIPPKKTLTVPRVLCRARPAGTLRQKSSRPRRHWHTAACAAARASIRRATCERKSPRRTSCARRSRRLTRIAKSRRNSPTARSRRGRSKSTPRSASSATTTRRSSSALRSRSTARSRPSTCSRTRPCSRSCRASSCAATSPKRST